MRIVIDFDPSRLFGGAINRLLHASQTLRDFWFPVLMAAWIVLIFVERLVVDYRIWAEDEGGTWAGSISRPGTVTYMLLAFPLVLAGLTLTERTVGRALGILKRLWLALQSSLLNPANLIIVALLLVTAVVLSTFQGRGLAEAVDDWLSGLNEQARQLAVVAGAAASFGLSFLILQCARKLFKSNTYREAYVAWLIAVPPFALNGLLYYGIYEVSVVRASDVSSLDLFWEGFVKDTVIYSIIAIFLVSGLYRWTRSDAFGRLSYSDRWVSFVVFVVVSLILALPALVLDFLAVRDLDIQNTPISNLYTQKWQRDTIAGHVALRDFALLVPLVFAVHLWVMSRILMSEKIPEALAAYGELADLNDRDLNDLASIQFRGSRPNSIEDWRRIHEALRDIGDHREQPFE